MHVINLLHLVLVFYGVRDSRATVSQTEVLETKPFISNKDYELDYSKLPCCEECTSNYEKEAHLLKSGQQKLPAWLQPHGAEARLKDEVLQLRRRWNMLCYSLHQGRHNPNHSSPSSFNHQSTIGKNHSFSTSSVPWLSTRNGIFQDKNSITFADHLATEVAGRGANLVPQFRRQQPCSTIEFNFDNGIQNHEVGAEATLNSMKPRQDKEVKTTLALGNSVFSVSRKEVTQRADMCKLLRENVPWQSESIPSIVEAIISNKPCSETWFLLDGNDCIGKKRLAQAAAEFILGSADSLLQIDLNKRDDEMNLKVAKLKRALKSSDKLVVLVEDVDMADAEFLKFLADHFEARKCGEVNRSDSNQHQAVFILTKGESARNEYHGSIIQMNLKVDEKSTRPSFGFPCLERKRKADQELQNRAKSPRFEEKEGNSSVVVAFENVNNSKGFSMQSSFNSSNLDLNLKAGEENETEDNAAGEVSPISSDLTRDTATDVRNPLGFLESIENMFVFNRSPARDREATELFLSKMEVCFEEGVNGVSFTVDKMVLEEIAVGSGSFPNSLFEKWLKEIFQTSLKSVKFGGKEDILVRLCLGGKEKQQQEEGEGILEGFLGSCLPKKIQIS